MFQDLRDQRLFCASTTLSVLFFAAALAYGQEAAPSSATPQPTAPAQTKPPVEKLPAAPGNPDNPAVNANAPEDKRAFGVLPNYRTAELNGVFQPLTTKQKFVIATKDSFDYPVYFTTAFFAGLSQWEGSDNEVYGQGVKGFAHRLGISYADQVVGNYFPEAIVPTLFHTDSRYFRKGEGSIPSRTFYAISRIFVCRTNSGNLTFNVNEFVGNSMAAIVASSYHPHERTPGDMADQAGDFIASDMVGQVLKEFWPDIKRKLQKSHH